MTAAEKQAIYDEIDRVMSGDAEVSPELDAKIDAVMLEDFPTLAAELGIA